MNKIDDLILLTLFILLVAGILVAAAISENKKEEQRSCVVVSTNITLIPAKPNTITILRNGAKETCYIYKEE